MVYNLTPPPQMPNNKDKKIKMNQPPTQNLEWENQVKGSLGTIALNPNNFETLKDTEETLIRFIKQLLQESEARAFNAGLKRALEIINPIEDEEYGGSFSHLTPAEIRESITKELKKG